MSQAFPGGENIVIKIKNEMAQYECKTGLKPNILYLGKEEIKLLEEYKTSVLKNPQFDMGTFLQAKIISSDIDTHIGLSFTEQKPQIPELIDSPDTKPLQKICQDYINDLAKNGYADEDYDHYIFETAMDVCFGEKVWDFIRGIQK